MPTATMTFDAMLAAGIDADTAETVARQVAEKAERDAKHAEADRYYAKGRDASYRGNREDACYYAASLYREANRPGEARLAEMYAKGL